MVTVIGFATKKNEKGENFNVLKLQGDVEMMRSTKTNQYYATAKKATISSTFDERTCKQLLGKQLPGIIEKEECDAYEYELPSKEKVVLSFRYKYNAEPSNVLEDVLLPA